MVDAGRDDLDAIGVGVVERRELRAFVVGRGEHQVRARDDLVLDARAQFRVVFETGVRLDAGERVERRDERQVELVLELVRDRAGEPVVRVQDVDGWRRQQQFACRVRERVDEIEQIVLGDGLARPGIDVQHTEAGFDLDDVGLLGVLGTRVDVAVDTGARERGRERVHVDVHPATVARARLGQRRRVHAEDGDAAL